MKTMAPIKRIGSKQRTEPQVTAEVLSRKRERDEAYYSFRKETSDQEFEILNKKLRIDT